MENRTPAIPEADQIREPGYVDFDRISDGDKKQIIRAQGGFFARGCGWRQKNIEKTGIPSCHMFCRWPEMTRMMGDERGIPVQDDELMAQTEKFAQSIEQKNVELADNGGGTVERADLYIGGSHLNDTEMPRDLLVKTYKRVSEIPGISTICIEARISDLNDEKLDELDRLAEFSKTKCMVSVGIETTNRDILKDVRKGISPESIRKGMEKIMMRKNLIAQGYLLVKPTVMSEKDSIEQSITDLKFIADVAAGIPEGGKININMAPVAAMEGTGAALNDAYKAPSLWSVIEIIKRLGAENKEVLDRVHLIFGLSTEGGEVAKEVTSCPDCEDAVRKVIEQFNMTQDPGVIESAPTCECQIPWKNRLDKEPFLQGTVHYPFDENNALARALYEQQIKGIMEVEKAFPEEIRASRETMEKRIQTAGGRFQFVGYNPKNGRITSYFVTQRLSSDEILAVDIAERGWDRLSQIKPTPDGDVLEGVSMGSLDDAPPGAGRAAVYASFDAIDTQGLTGLSGVIRIPGLQNIKTLVEEKLGRELTEEEISSMGQQYVDAHYTRFDAEKAAKKLDKSALSFAINIGGSEVPIECEMDENLSFWGRMPHTRGTVVKSMEEDAESCKLGLWLFYQGKNAKRIMTETQKSVEEVMKK